MIFRRYSVCQLQRKQRKLMLTILPYYAVEQRAELQSNQQILEDPAIFDELVDSGLLNLDGCLKIGQVLGAN